MSERNTYNCRVVNEKIVTEVVSGTLPAGKCVSARTKYAGTNAVVDRPTNLVTIGAKGGSTAAVVDDFSTYLL